MTDYIVPPPELMRQWMTEFYGTPIVPGEACIDLAISELVVVGIEGRYLPQVN
jgi:hypothetical protein